MNSASKITIITDSASDMPGNLHNQVTVLPMTISFGDEQFEDGVTLSADEFYMKLIESDTLPKTKPGKVLFAFYPLPMKLHSPILMPL